MASEQEHSYMNHKSLPEFLAAHWADGDFVPYCYVNAASDSLAVYFKGDPDDSVVIENDHIHDRGSAQIMRAECAQSARNIALCKSLVTHEVVGGRSDGLSKIDRFPKSQTEGRAE